MKYFTSDSHFGHARILELGDGRPFKSVNHMNQFLVEEAWKVMSPDDTLYHLGDMAMGNFEESIAIAASLPGVKKFLIPGNHDKIFPKLNTVSRIERFKPMYEDAGFEVLDLQETVEIEADGVIHDFLMSHVPYSPERFEGRSDKLAFARPEDTGMWLIHGHTHSRDKFSDHPREIHVGVDANNWRPVSEIEIIERKLMLEKVFTNKKRK